MFIIIVHQTNKMTSSPGPTTPSHLDPSELGTKEYWNTLYARESANHASNTSDIGTVWFDDSDAEAKMIRFLNELPSLSGQKQHASLLDLGCGNGSMLFSLRGEHWSGPALGVDRSPQSVRLARQIASSKDDDDGADRTPVSFAEWDAIAGPYETVMLGPAQQQGWDVVLDKGTFDAISLSDERLGGRRLCEIYPERVLRLVKKGGILLITSCNWTEDELTNWFAGKDAEPASEDGRFVVAGRVEYRTFSFGGVKGQTISTLCFRRV